MTILADPNKTYYLGGPMSGYEDFNFPAFEEAEQKLTAQDFKVVSAHKVDHGVHTGAGTQPYVEYLKGDLIVMIRDCNAIILLPGWNHSKGARLEHDVAKTLEYDRYMYIQGSIFPLAERV